MIRKTRTARLKSFDLVLMKKIVLVLYWENPWDL